MNLIFSEYPKQEDLTMSTLFFLPKIFSLLNVPLSHNPFFWFVTISDFLLPFLILGYFGHFLFTVVVNKFLYIPYQLHVIFKLILMVHYVPHDYTSHPRYVCLNHIKIGDPEPYIAFFMSFLHRLKITL